MQKLLIMFAVVCFNFTFNAYAQTIPIQAEFPGKVVYTTDAAFDKTILEKDCQKRGGAFNECGSVCDDQKSDATTCVSVCAFTCQLTNNQQIM